MLENISFRDKKLGRDSALCSDPSPRSGFVSDILGASYGWHLKTSKVVQQKAVTSCNSLLPLCCDTVPQYFLGRGSALSQTPVPVILHLKFHKFPTGNTLVTDGGLANRGKLLQLHDHSCCLYAITQFPKYFVRRVTAFFPRPQFQVIFGSKFQKFPIGDTTNTHVVMWWSQPKSTSVGCGFHLPNLYRCRVVARSKLLNQNY